MILPLFTGRAQRLNRYRIKKVSKMEEPKFVKGEQPRPDTRSWYEYLWKTEQETPNRIEDAAKFLSGIIAVCLTIFLTPGREAFAQYRGAGLAAIIAAVVLWTLALLVSFLVVFPQRYRYVGESVQSMKEMNQRVTRRKYRLLIACLALFSAGMILLAAGIFF